MYSYQVNGFLQRALRTNSLGAGRTADYLITKTKWSSKVPIVLMKIYAIVIEFLPSTWFGEFC